MKMTQEEKKLHSEAELTSHLEEIEKLREEVNEKET